MKALQEYGFKLPDDVSRIGFDELPFCDIVSPRLTMAMCGVSEFWQMVIKGLVIVLAVIIDQLQRNMQVKMALQARNESK